MDISPGAESWRQCRNGLAHQHRRIFRPFRHNIGQRQRLHVAALRRRPAMRHQLSKVRPATLRRIAADGGERRRGRPPDGPRASRNARSIVAHSSSASQPAPRLLNDNGRAVPSPRPGSASVCAAVCHRSDPTPSKSQSGRCVWPSRIAQLAAVVVSPVL